MTWRPRAWWQGRSDREQRLLAAVAGLVLLGAGGRVHSLVQDDFDRLRRRISAAERRLTAARMLAGRLEGSIDTTAPDVSLVSLVETTVTSLIGTERLARLEPGDDPNGQTDARLTGVALADVVRVLAALETTGADLRVQSIELRLLPNEETLYDATVGIVRGSS